MTFAVSTPNSTSIYHIASGSTFSASLSYEQEGKQDEIPVYETSASIERKQQLETQSTKVEHEVEESLWNQLHFSIREIHCKAMQVEFLRDLIAGKMSCSKAYVVYLCNLFWLHQGLEMAQAKLVEKYGEGGFVFPALYRSQRLLEDIKLWSFPNPTAPFFADKDLNSAEFLEHVRHFVEPCVLKFVLKLEASVEEDPIWAIGPMYALYGTILSGGQLVKKGVTQSFLNRIDEHIEDDLTLDGRCCLNQLLSIQAKKDGCSPRLSKGPRVYKFFVTVQKI